MIKGIALAAVMATAVQAAEAVTRTVERDLLHHMSWLPGQVEVFSDPSTSRLFRAGNQSQGKTIAGCAEALWEARGKHPFRPATRPGTPAEVWILCASWDQSKAIQKKLWTLAPRSWIHPDTKFSDEHGFGTKSPILKVRHHSGGWSIIRIKTTGQGGLRLAGATIDFAVFDEPPDSQRVYSEVKKRLQSTAGRLLMTLTPVNRDCTYLRTEVEEGRLVDHHFPLRAENMIPVGKTRPIRLKDGTPCDQAWIDGVRADTIDYEIPVIVDGEWEFRAVQRIFSAFDAVVHVHTRLPSGEVQLRLGIDHGTDVIKVRGDDGRMQQELGRQCAVLMATWREEGDAHDRVYIVDSWRASGLTTPDEDADAILEMLSRHGQTWADLHQVWGDRVHLQGSASRKSNRDLQAAIARRLRVRTDAVRPPVQTAKRGAGRGAGSVMTGVRWLHHQMVRPGHFGCSPRARHVVDAIEKWDLSADSVWKDPLDGVRYGLEPLIFRHRGGMGGGVEVRVQ